MRGRPHCTGSWSSGTLPHSPEACCRQILPPPLAAGAATKKSSAAAGLSCDAPKRTRSSTRLSRTGSSTWRRPVFYASRSCTSVQILHESGRIRRFGCCHGAKPARAAREIARQLAIRVRAMSAGYAGRNMSTAERQTKDALAEVQARIARAAEAGERDQSRAPLLEALRAYHQVEHASFSIPAHKGGRALDEETRA